VINECIVFKLDKVNHVLIILLHVPIQCIRKLFRPLEPDEHLWRDQKIAVQRRSPSNSREEWEKLSKYRCAKLVKSYSRRLEAVICAKVAPTK
jgi:hypothetical protein